MSDNPLRDLLRTAAMQARLAACLYSGESAVKRLAASVGAKSIYVVHGHTAAAALVFRDHVHLSICGTNDIRDWFAQNLDAHQMVVAGFRCHRGLATSAAMIYVELMRKGLTDLLRGRQLIIGGHSAGGAIAEILTLEPCMQPREVITFGAPRVWSADSAATYRAQPWHVYRFVSGGDPVPGMPLRRFRCIFGRAAYSHASPAMELTDDGRVLMDQKIDWLRRLVRWAAGWWLYGRTVTAPVTCGMPTLLSNHHLSRYTARLATALQRIEA